MGKYLMKKIRNIVLLMMIGSTLGLIALVVVHYIPLDKIKCHVQQSVPMLERDFLYGDAIEGYPASCVGSFTDCLMLEHAVYFSKEHSVLEQVLFMYRGESSEGDGWAPGYSLIDYLSGVSQNREVEYSRYWHGYLVILKPLLYFMSFNGIRTLASCIQLLLVAMVLMLCFQKYEKILGFGFLASMPFLYFSNLYLSLSLSICFYLLVILVIIQIMWNDRIYDSHRYEEFFVIAGMITAYFDFLTYPLVTLGFPLCIYLYLNASKWKDSLKQMVTNSVAWAVGYLGLWAMKWVFTDILAGGNTIQDAISTIFQRTGNAEGYSKMAGFISVVIKNLDAYANWAFYITSFVIIISVISLLIISRKQLMKGNLGCTLSILIVGLYPFVWFFLTQNHSEEHWLFTCKIMSISVFAFVCATGKIFRLKERGNYSCGSLKEIDSF